jgi:hypothetical protein
MVRAFAPVCFWIIFPNVQRRYFFFYYWFFHFLFRPIRPTRISILKQFVFFSPSD